jgi:hypothetical protein
MRLDWMMLANHAEVSNGLLYVNGGGWDTIQVHGRAEELPEDVFAIMFGYLVVRLLFHATETDREHDLRFTVMDEDGKEIASSAAPLPVKRNEDLPPNWLQNIDIVQPVTGIALPRAGFYVVNLNVNGQWVGDRQFRVAKLYD